MNKLFSGVALLGALGIGVVQWAACGGSEPSVNAQPACNDDLKTLDLGAGATITLVKSFKTGDPLSLGKVQGAPMTVTADVCLVKIIVGPGNPGPADAPSTSAGIGVEVWLPTPSGWNERYQAIGGGGWQGGPEFTSLTAIGSIAVGPGGGPPPLAVIRAAEGFATSTTDTGHAVGTGAFAMNPDGSFNQTLFEDFAERSVHEMVLKTKSLLASYYGRPAKYSYWFGCSTGGRQGLMEAQRHPDDFDGVLAAAPAINWDRAVVATVWPQIVMQQDLGGPIASAKLAAVTAAATAACGASLTGVNDGYISDPSACRYDPTKDQKLLCVAAGGSSTSASCLTFAEASAINKIWFGPTTDGATPPPPATNNGWGAGAALAVGQLWYGLARGTLLDRLAGASAFGIGTDQVALSLLDPTYAAPAFVNATGNGTNNWKTIGYTGPVSFTAVVAQSVQRFHDVIGTDNPDLSAFNARRGKLIMWHGTRDSLLPPQGSSDYYERVAAQVGGYAATQQFARFYLVPGVDHCIPYGVNPPIVRDLPDPGDQPGTTLASLLEGWVENGAAPGQITATSAPGVTPVRTRPWCLYPTKLTYVSGDVNTGTFTCQ